MLHKLWIQLLKKFYDKNAAEKKMNQTEARFENVTAVEGEVVGFSGTDVTFTDFVNCTGTDGAQTP